MDADALTQDMLDELARRYPRDDAVLAQRLARRSSPGGSSVSASWSGAFAPQGDGCTQNVLVTVLQSVLHAVGQMSHQQVLGTVMAYPRITLHDDSGSILVQGGRVCSSGRGGGHVHGAWPPVDGLPERAVHDGQPQHPRCAWRPGHGGLDRRRAPEGGAGAGPPSSCNAASHVMSTCCHCCVHAHTCTVFSSYRGICKYVSVRVNKLMIVTFTEHAQHGAPILAFPADDARAKVCTMHRHGGAWHLPQRAIHQQRAVVLCCMLPLPRMR